ncbi:MAG: hypothetical protein QM759_11605 [Terricaulis sp.]
MSTALAFDADFDFTFDVVDGFFKTPRIQRTLNAIHKTEVSGWEKWWQIELALYLSTHGGVSDRGMEEEFNTDRRRERVKDWLAIDIFFRRKRCASDKMELKQNPDWRRCIDNMLLDVAKVHRSQQRSMGNLSIRNFFVLGVYPSVEKSEVKGYIFERALLKEKTVSDFEIDRVETRFISGTDYSFTLF